MHRRTKELKELNLAAKVMMLFSEVLQRDRKRVVLFVIFVESFASESEASGGDWVFVFGELVEYLEVDFGWKGCEGGSVVWKD